MVNLVKLILVQCLGSSFLSRLLSCDDGMPVFCIDIQLSRNAVASLSDHIEILGSIID